MTSIFGAHQCRPVRWHIINLCNSLNAMAAAKPVKEPALPRQPQESSVTTHQVMAATIVHEARVDGITAVAIASIAPLADTLALQERYFSFIDLPEHPHLLSKKCLRQQNISLIYFSKFSSWSLKTWKCRVVSLAGHHPLAQHSSCLVIQAHWSSALLGCGGHLKMMVFSFISRFSGNDTDFVNGRKRS